MTGGASQLPFDRIQLVSDDGTRRALSAQEFMALPLDVRIRALLDRSLEFFAGSQPVDRKVALASLRQRTASR